MLAAAPSRRVRAVGDLYRLLLDERRTSPATTSAALAVARLLEDPRTLAEDRWRRGSGRRSLRAELLDWLASFADIARLEADAGAGAGTGAEAARDPLTAAHTARRVLHDRVAAFCEDPDPQVREAALATVALLLADPALASYAPRYAPAVRTVLAVSADSYYRWIARERLTAWGEDDGAPGGEDRKQPTGHPGGTAAPEHRARPAPARPAPGAPVPEPPVAAPGSEPGYRGPWRIAREEERAEWTFTPYGGVGPLHFGMTLTEVAGALGERPAGSLAAHHGEVRRLDHADFPGHGIRALFRNDRLGCVAVDALTGPQVRLYAAPLTGCTPSHVENWLVHRTTPRPGSLMRTPTADPVFAELGLALRPQRAGDLVLTRPLFLLPDWLDLWHRLPGAERSLF
ncbi:hypothetical protein BU197_00050 [Streptomyces sp. CBMA291]|nr:hypothetical protein [Streptomyces sp. CBMA291]MBD0715001.1 hypothetical protein [Streptomyces sp. CBMA370]